VPCLIAALERKNVISFAAGAGIKKLRHDYAH